MRLINKMGDIIIEDKAKYVTYGKLIKNCYYNSIDLTDVILKKADLTGECFSYMNLYDITFKECFFNNSDCANVIFKNCDLSKSSFRGANLHKATFKNCDFSNCDFTGAYLEDCLFENCNTDNIYLDGAILLLTDNKYELENFYNDCNNRYGKYEIEISKNNYVFANNHIYCYGLVITKYNKYIEKLTKDQIKEHFKKEHNKDIEIID